MRLFVALEIPSTVRDAFRRIDERSACVGVEIFRKEAALGAARKSSRNVEVYRPRRAGKAGSDSAALAKASSEKPVDVRFRGLGFFPNDKRPRVIWAGVAGSPDLASIARNVDAGLAKLGIPGEERAFTPHLTLARCERPGISAELRVAVARDVGSRFRRVAHERISSDRKQAEILWRGVHYAAIVRLCGGGVTAHA